MKRVLLFLILISFAISMVAYAKQYPVEIIKYTSSLKYYEPPNSVIQGNCGVYINATIKNNTNKIIQTLVIQVKLYAEDGSYMDESRNYGAIDNDYWKGSYVNIPPNSTKTIKGIYFGFGRVNKPPHTISVAPYSYK